MSTAADLFRRAADVIDDSAIGERKELALKLIALHAIRSCGSGENAEEARILMRLLEG